MSLLDGDFRQSVDTPLLSVVLRGAPGIDLYFKDESAHPTGSLKHRLARALFSFGIVSGTIRAGVPIVEASSGSTAVSVAYFAHLLGLAFHAVMPASTSLAKLAEIRRLGSVCHVVPPGNVYADAEMLARDIGGTYLDQFTHAERVSDWRCDNLASAMLAQLAGERHSIPAWIVVGAGTGGTATTIGRHLRSQRVPTRLCVADVERSAFFQGYVDENRDAVCSQSSRIEGVGRPRIEPSFVPQVIDRMMKFPDAVTLAGMRMAGDLLGRSVGPSTGLNFVAAALLAREMAAEEVGGSIVTLICDGGDRYEHTCHDDRWLNEQGLLGAVESAEQLIRAAFD